MRLFLCACYLAATGILAFFIGRMLAGHRFRYDVFPFSSFGFEQDGQLYKRLRVSVWQSRVPDMSRICRKLMPPKKLEGRPDENTLGQMINETCIAELIHFLLCLSGLAVLWLWPGTGGLVVWLVYCIFGNLPFIVIQRYNRPRFARLLRRCAGKETGQ